MSNYSGATPGAFWPGQTYPSQPYGFVVGRGVDTVTGLPGVVTKHYTQVSVPGSSHTTHAGTAEKAWPGRPSAALVAAIGVIDEIVITDADYDIAEQSPDRYPVWAVKVDWTGEDFTGVAADLTDIVTAITVERETTGELPAESGLVDGYATGQVTVELAGTRPGADTPFAAEVSPWRVDSPLYGKTMVTPTAQVDLGLSTDQGPKVYRQLTGPVRSLKVSESAQTVEMIAVDPSERIRELITLPTYAEFVTHAVRRPWAITVNTQWVVDHVLRQNGIYASPAPRPDAIISCTGHGGLASEIGFNGAPISIYGTGPQVGLWTEDNHPWNMLGTPENSSGGTVGYQEFYGITDGITPPFKMQAGYGLGLSAWLHIGSYMNLGASFENRIFQVRPGDISTDNDDNQYPRLFLSGFGDGSIYAGLSLDANTVYATPHIATGSERWRHVGLHFQFTTNTTLVVTVRVDAVTYTYTLNVTAPTMVYGYRPSLQVNGQMFRAWTNLQAWPSYTPPTLTEWQDLEHHVPEADVARGVNELLYLPDVAAADSWEVLKAVVASEFGVHGFDPSGRYFFRPRTDVRTVDASVDIDVATNLSDVGYTLSSDSVRNVIGYSSTPKYHSGTWQTIVSAQDPLQFICPPGVTQFPLDFPWGAASRNSGILPYYFTDADTATNNAGTQPQWSSDVVNGWTYSYGSNWSGEDNIEIVVVTWCQTGPRSMLLTVNNTGSTTVRLGTDLDIADPTGTPGDPAMKIGGWPMVALDDHVAEYRNDDSIAEYGTRALALDTSDWRQTPGALDPVAQALLAAMAKPTPVLEDLPVRGNPQVQVGQIARLKFSGEDAQPIYGAIVKTSRELSSSGLVDSISVRPLPLQTLAPEGRVFWIDVSSYQFDVASPLDLTRMATLGYAGCAAKIGQGSSTPQGYGSTLDAYWSTVAPQAKALWGPAFAGYWYVGETETPAAQAARCAAALGAGGSMSLFDAQPVDYDRVRTDGWWTLGVEVRLTRTAQVTALRYYRGAYVTGTVRGRLYRVNSASSGTAVTGTDVTFTLSGLGWQTATLTSPVTLTPGTYRIAVNLPGGFAETDSYWIDGPGAVRVDKGLFLAPGVNDAVGGGQCVFQPGSTLSYPADHDAYGKNWWIDWVVTTTVDQTPVILDWEVGGGSWTNLLAVRSALISAGVNVTMLYAASGYADANGATAIDSSGMALWRARYWVNDSGNPRSLWDDQDAGFGYEVMDGGTPQTHQFTQFGVPYAGAPFVDVSDYPGTADGLVDLFWGRALPPVGGGISEDTSTPDVVHRGLGSSGTVTSDSFSPPVGALLVVMVAVSWSDTSPSSVPSLAVSDTLSGQWTAGPASFGNYAQAAIFTSRVTSPGARTVTVGSGSTYSKTMQLAVRVVDGAASSQAAASTSVSTTSMSTTIPTTVAGSWVYVVGISPTNNASLPATAATEVIDAWQDTSSDGDMGVGLAAAATVTPGSETLGWSVSGRSVALEVLPA